MDRSYYHYHDHHHHYRPEAYRMTIDFGFDAEDVLPDHLTRYVDFTVDAELDPFPDDGFDECEGCGRERDLRPLLKQDEQTGELVIRDVCASCQTNLVDQKRDLVEHQRVQGDPDHPPEELPDGFDSLQEVAAALEARQSDIEVDPDAVPDGIAEAADAIADGADPDEVFADLDPADLIDADDPIAELEGTPTDSIDAEDLAADGGD